jgi:transcriptional regulator with AAA-type ATPase domain
VSSKSKDQISPDDPSPRRRGKIGESPLQPLPEEGRIEGWLHSSRIPAEERERILKFAASGLPVFIEGEEGTGKSEVARALHFLGPWKKSPFLRIPCRGLTPPSFVERILLWGKGGKPGPKVSLTLFLENLESLQEDMQALLQDLLSSRQIPWPGLEETVFDVQVLSSSSGDMAEPVTAGKFREDLFQSLGTLILHLPPLRERKEDLPRMVQEILREKAREGGEGKIFSSEALQALQAHNWPGNLAELESLVLRSAVLKEGDLIEPEDLAFRPYRDPLFRGTPFREGKDSWFDVTIPTLTHEIKNPLVAISTFAHLLPDKYDDPEFRQEFSRLVSQDVRRINALFENLLEFAQFSSPQSSLQDLNAALEEFLGKQGKVPGKAVREIITDLGNALPPILFDKTHLNFVLRNLLEHALFKGNAHFPLHISTRFAREEEMGRRQDSVDMILWYNGPEGGLGDFSRIVGFKSKPEFQNLNLALLLIRKVLLRNGGKMQVLQEEDGGMTLRVQFPAGK